MATVLVGGLVWSAATGQAPPSQQPRIFGGSLVLDDYRPLTVIDLATGAVTVQLEGVYAQVGASNYSDVEAVGTTAGTMLVNRLTGTFNMLGQDNYVLGPSATGISLGPLAGATGASDLASGAASYIIRYAPASTISLVDATTVEAGAQELAALAHHPVRPVGFARLSGTADSQPGGATVARGALWLLQGTGEKCRLERMAPSSRAVQGLSTAIASTLSVACRKAAAETVSGTVGLALPGEVELFAPHAALQTVSVRATEGASQFLPVQGVSGHLWYLAKLSSGWEIFGVGPTGTVVGPTPLLDLGPGSEPVVPVYSAGRLYTLDQGQPGQPTLWTIQPTTGAMRPVAGVSTYPAKNATEKANFVGAQVLVDGPRVIFNNPGSLLAVVVFTDGSHAPVIVDKSTAVVVSAAGPGDVNVKAQKHKSPSKPRSHPSSPQLTTTPTTVVQPLTQPVTQQANCATTTEKPYEPQVRSISPADGSALVTWTYHLLSEQDCLPSTWSVTVTATDGGAQPRHPVQLVNGQQQLLLTGLVPGTGYKAFVTAYINKQFTSSAPVSFSTTAVGPGAPAAVSVVAQGDGGWLVSWAPCQGQACEVPAKSWALVASSCGTGFVGQPPELTVPGTDTRVTVNAGNDLGLLGDSLQFSVQGVGSTGLPGAPTAGPQCLRSWEPPDPSDLRLLATGTAVGQTVTAGLDVVVAPGAPPVQAFGGDPVTYTYSLGGQSLGPTTAPDVDVAGLGPARSYRATVTVTPVGHPRAAVTLSSAPFGQTLPWPGDLRMQVTGSVGADADAGTAVASFPGLPSGPFEAQGRITCGSETLPVSGLLSGAQFLAAVDLDELGGRCTLAVTLLSTLAPDPYGVPSPTLRGPFSIGASPSYRFSAVAGQTCLHDCRAVDLYISFNAPGQPAGTSWQVTASDGPGCNQASAILATASFPVTLSWPVRCQTPTVTVSWMYLGQPASATASLPSVPPATRAPTSGPTSTSTSRPTSSSTSTSSTTTPSTTTTARATTTTARATTTTTRATTTRATTTRATTTTARATTTTARATTTTARATTTTATTSTTATTPPRTTLPPTSTTVTTARQTTTTTIPTTTTTLAPTTTACDPTGGTGCPATTSTTNPCPVTTVDEGVAVCEPGTTTTTTTVVPTTTTTTVATTTTTVPTTEPTTPTTTPAATTTTTSSSTTTAPAATTTSTPTTTS